MSYLQKPKKEKSLPATKKGEILLPTKRIMPNGKKVNDGCDYYIGDVVLFLAVASVAQRIFF
ncbi:MAG: hypothetical protein WC878_03805 [Candidatus Paceibacterota bacterium]